MHDSGARSTFFASFYIDKCNEWWSGQKFYETESGAQAVLLKSCVRSFSSWIYT